MKITGGFLQKLITFIIFFTVPFCVNAQQDGVAGYWKFDENNGKNTLDEVSHIADSIHNIFSNPVRRNGISGEALVFDGFSTWIEERAGEFATPAKAITISVWVAPRAFEAGDGEKLSAFVNQQNPNEKSGFAFGMFRHGSWSLQLGTGNQWFEVWDEHHPIPRQQWSYLVATYEAATGEAVLYLNGKQVSQRILPQHLPIKPAAVPLIIGKNNQPEYLDKRSKIALNMFNGFMDELKIYNRALTKAEIEQSYRTYLSAYHNKIPVISYDEMKIDRNQFKDDPYRPQDHAIPPGAWMNEPHAPFFYNGKYHLTYQHNPTGPYWHQIEWGHWVSDDLVHWHDLPSVLYPENDTVAPDGIWTGSATFDENGVPALFYTAGNWSKAHSQAIAVAHPKNPSDPDLTEWVKEPKPIITQMDGQGLTGEFRDPFVWKDKEDNKWYLLVGSGIQEKGGTAWFYESDNCHDWKLKGHFYLSDYKKYPFLGSIWELPVFLPIGKYDNGETRYIFIVSPKGYRQNVEVYYWLGRFDKKNGRFVPDNEEPQYWDYGVHGFIGPSGMIDPKTGRVLIFAIAAGGHGPGWAAGCASFPSNIFLDKEGNLGVKPINELSSLRKNELLTITNKTLWEANQQLGKIKGDMLEIILDMKSDAGRYGIKLRKTPDGKEETLILYDNDSKKLLADKSKSSLTFSNARDPVSGTDKRVDVIRHFDLKGDDLKLHIFIDKGLIQAYANDKKTITTWIYPSLKDAKGLEVWSENGKATIKSMQVWEMKSIYY